MTADMGFPDSEGESAEPEPIDIAGDQVEQGLVHDPDPAGLTDADEGDEDDDDEDDEVNGGEDDDVEYEEGLLGEDDED